MDYYVTLRDKDPFPDPFLLGSEYKKAEGAELSACIQ